MADTERRPEDFGRYLLVDLIGRGGMAEVFRARLRSEGSIHKTVVVKRILPHLCEEKAFVGMFRDEAKLTLRMNHPNVVQVFDFGFHAGHWFLVMEWVNGSNLREVMLRAAPWGAFPTGLALFIAAEMARGLAHAHGMKDDAGEPLGLVHRDISPHNVLLSFDGGVKVADFGIAKARNRLTETNPGIVKGKVPYLAPEAAGGRGVTARSDIYGVGVTLWELLAGRRLMAGNNEMKTLNDLAELGEHPLISTVRPVPPEVDELIASAIAADPVKRTATAQKFAKDAGRLATQLGADIDELAAAMDRWFRRPPPKPADRDTAEIDNLAARMLRDKIKDAPPRLEKPADDRATKSGTKMAANEITLETTSRKARAAPGSRIATAKDFTRAGIDEAPVPVVAPAASPSRPAGGAVRVDLTGRFASLETFFLEGYATYQGGGRGLFIQGDEGLRLERGSEVLVGLFIERPRRSFVLRARVLWHRVKEKVEGGRRKAIGTAVKFLPGVDRDRLYAACGLEPEPEAGPPENTERALVAGDVAGCDLVAHVESADIYLRDYATKSGKVDGLFLPAEKLDIPVGRAINVGIVFADPRLAFVLPARIAWTRGKVAGRKLAAGYAIEFDSGQELDDFLRLLGIVRAR